MGARYLDESRIEGAPTASCACCQQLMLEFVQVAPIRGRGDIAFCLSCCADITAAASESTEPKDQTP